MSDENQKSSKPKKSQAQGTFSSLRGYPGYRTRAGRSGLDPIDNDAEGGHMTGVLLHHLMTGRLRTRNPFILLVWTILGLGITPFILAILEALRGNLLPFGAWVVITIAGLFGILMLVNVIRNILHFLRK
jgi:hypothetical protein